MLRHTLHPFFVLMLGWDSWVFVREGRQRKHTACQLHCSCYGWLWVQCVTQGQRGTCSYALNNTYVSFGNVNLGQPLLLQYHPTLHILFEYQLIWLLQIFRLGAKIPMYIFFFIRVNQCDSIVNGQNRTRQHFARFCNIHIMQYHWYYTTQFYRAIWQSLFQKSQRSDNSW